jgi:hypothetical protein
MAGLEAASFDESILEKPRRHGMDDCFFVGIKARDEQQVSDGLMHAMHWQHPARQWGSLQSYFYCSQVAKMSFLSVTVYCLYSA